MRQDSPTIVSWLQYLALRGVWNVLHTFDERQNYGTARTVGSLYYRCNPGRRARAERNIRLSFPDWPEQQVREVAQASMQYMAELFMIDPLLMLRKLTPTSWEQSVRLRGVDTLLDKLNSKQPLLLITGHCGNWELLGYFLSMIGYPMAALARPLDNPLLDRWLLDIRQRRGLRVITKWGATPILQKLIARGGRIGFIADQNAGDNGLFVPFFGRLASSYKSIGLLAMRYKLPIVAGMAMRRGQGFSYEITCTDFIEPSEWADAPDPLFYITARYNRAIEQMIRRHPTQYLWLHRRWKSRPKHERQGKPMPRRLVEQLRSLPWVTDESLGHMIEASNRAAVDTRRAAARQRATLTEQSS